jgi:hypothetical protein
MNANNSTSPSRATRVAAAVVAAYIREVIAS